MIASIVTAGLEDFLPIIIFFVVIGRIFGAIKKTASGKPNTPGTPASRPKLETDLQKFFENIANQAAPPPPPPVPAAQKARTIPKARVAEAPKPVAGPAYEPYQMESKPWSGKPFGPDVPERSTCSITPEQNRAELVKMIKDENSIRKAILLREILGPPVSMRT